MTPRFFAVPGINLAASAAYGGLGGNGLFTTQGLLESLSVRQEGDDIVMDKESFVNLIQILRIQMMMESGSHAARDSPDSPIYPITFFT